MYSLQNDEQKFVGMLNRMNPLPDKNEGTNVPGGGGEGTRQHDNFERWLVLKAAARRVDNPRTWRVRVELEGESDCVRVIAYQYEGVKMEPRSSERPNGR